MAMVQVQAYIPDSPIWAQGAFIQELNECVPGYTTHAGRGVWKDSEGTIVHEDVLVFTMLIDEETELPDVVGLLQQYKINAVQEAVLYTVQDIDVVFI